MGHRRDPSRWSRPRRDLGWAPDPLLRLEAIVPPDAERMQALAERLKLSTAEAERLKLWALAPTIAPDDQRSASWRRTLYRGDRQADRRPAAAGAGVGARARPSTTTTR